MLTIVHVVHTVRNRASCGNSQVKTTSAVATTTTVKPAVATTHPLGGKFPR